MVLGIGQQVKFLLRSFIAGSIYNWHDIVYEDLICVPINELGGGLQTPIIIGWLLQIINFEF